MGGSIMSPWRTDQDEILVAKILSSFFQLSKLGDLRQLCAKTNAQCLFFSKDGNCAWYYPGTNTIH